MTDISGEYAHNRLYVETLLWKIPPGTTSITIGEKRAMQVNEYQKDSARIGLAEPRCRILIADAVGLGKTIEAGILCQPDEYA